MVQRSCMSSAPGSETDDETVVAQSLADPAKFSILYERHFLEIRRFVTRRVPDATAAEDITSQVFLNALRSLSTYQSGYFLGWLYRIARNLIADHYRQTLPLPHSESLALHPDTNMGPPELAEEAEAREEVERLIRQLTPAQQDIVRLRLQGYRGQEIADTLGISLNAVKSAQFRAFNRIRTLMTDPPSQRPRGPGRRSGKS
jgi:RNA polymerase sigma-70 factor (ECF subfamily)